MMMMAMADFVARFLLVAAGIAVAATAAAASPRCTSWTVVPCLLLLPCALRSTATFCFVSLQLIVVVIVVIIVSCFLAFVCIGTSVFSCQVCEVCVVAKVAMIHNKISSICGYKLNITLIYKKTSFYIFGYLLELGFFFFSSKYLKVAPLARESPALTSI
jgi:hypothetical protein